MPLERAGSCTIILVLLGALNLLSGCSSAPVTRSLDPELAARLPIDELAIVDCVVEGTVMMMGNRAYQTPARVGRMTRFECSSMGGTQKLYDPANPEAQLALWLPDAERGDSDAQNRLGLLYEGALGIEPSYPQAVRWYRRAADQGHVQSMFSLATLYERGLGVNKDALEALEWYRRAAGLDSGALMLSEDASREIESVRTSLAQEIGSLSSEIEGLTSVVARLQDEAQRDSSARQQIQQLSATITKLEDDLSNRATVLRGLPETTPPARSTIGSIEFERGVAFNLGGKELGRGYALVVGVSNYQSLPVLSSPHNDARRIHDLLGDRFGYSAQLLLDPNEEQVKRAVHALLNTAGPDDSVVIYFAGHGELLDRPQHRPLGYWLPVNADRDQDTNWVDNDWITNQLEVSKARRALVVADSCYGGLLSTDISLPPWSSDLTSDQLSAALDRRARYVLSSGDVQPVADGGGGPHSSFAAAFIRALQNAGGTVRLSALYAALYEQVVDASSRLGIDQEPQLRSMKAAGHAAGDFIFRVQKP